MSKRYSSAITPYMNFTFIEVTIVVCQNVVLELGLRDSTADVLISDGFSTTIIFLD
jgi:hypothetical protein